MISIIAQVMYGTYSVSFKNMPVDLASSRADTERSRYHFKSWPQYSRGAGDKR